MSTVADISTGAVPAVVGRLVGLPAAPFVSRPGPLANAAYGGAPARRPRAGLADGTPTPSDDSEVAFDPGALSTPTCAISAVERPACTLARYQQLGE